ncbi:MAG TPA: phosphatase PAP2 family protein [Stellaceae bacterium]|nr:phosphatase PAP2 family protein [Stellaceae bacterium]
MHHLAISITDLGDSAVTLPMAAVTILILLGLRRVGPAVLWGGSVVACALTIGVLKLILTAAASHHSPTGFSSPSGHAGMSAIVYGGFVLLIGPSLAPAERWLARLGAVVLIAAIAVSRIVLHEHSLAETAVGLGIGLAALTGLNAAFKRAPAQRVPAIWLCAAAVATILAMHGTRWRAEHMIRDLASSDVTHTLLPGRG